MITNLTDSIPTLYGTECAMNEYDDWTTTTHAVCARYRPTASHSKVPHVRMSDVDSDSDGNLNDPEALVAQFNSINTAFFCPDDCIEKSSSSFASLESYIYDSICSVTSVEEHAWDLRDGQVGRHIVAARFIPAGSIVFSESPLIVAEATSFGERALRGEMAAAAVALLQLPAGRSCEAARLLQTPKGLPERSRKNLALWALQLQMALGARNVTREDGSPVPRTRDSTLWALGVSSINAHHASEPTRAVIGLLSSMMEHSCMPSCEMEIASVSDGSTLTLRTTRDVQQGESLSITYLDCDAPVTERLGQLAFQHGFICRCERCCDEAGQMQTTPVDGVEDNLQGAGLESDGSCTSGALDHRDLTHVFPSIGYTTYTSKR